MFGIDKVFGLPVHALVVHFAVILVPLAVVALIATCWRPAWRKQYILPIAVLAIAGAAAALVAAQSGGSLKHQIEREARASGQVQTVSAEGESGILGDHPEQGNIAEVTSIAFAGAATVLLGLELWGARVNATSLHFNLVYLASCGIGVLALIAMVAAGHSGATLVWKDLGNFVHPSGA